MEANTSTADETAQAGRGEPETIWFPELGETPKSALLATGELLLVPTQGKGLTAQHTALRALNLRDGSLCWQKQIEHGSVSGMASAGELILVATYSTDLLRGQGTLLALDPTGGIRWPWTLDAQRLSAPAVAEDVVCVTVDTKTLIVLSAATGMERAKGHLSVSASPWAPAISSVAGRRQSSGVERKQAQDVAYVPCRGPHLLAIGLDGRTHWSFTSENSPDAWLDKTPVVVGDRVYTVTTTGIVVAVETRDGTLAWQVNVGPPGKSLSPPATDGQRLYVGARDGLYAIDLGDGKQAWHLPMARRIVAAPIVGGSGVIYAAGHDHNLYAVDADTGKALWHVELERRIEVAPVTSGDIVLAADHEGHIVRVRQILGRVERARALADSGEFQVAGEILEAEDKPLEAAEMYKKAGDPTRASGQYELAGALVPAADMLKAAGNIEEAAGLYERARAWTQALELWEQLGYTLRYAETLAKRAESLDARSHSKEELAAAWEQVANCFDREGETERAAQCREQVARHQGWPILDLEVQNAEGLVVNAWSRIQFIVRNRGYGPARNLVIRAEGEQFEGQVRSTQQIATVHKERERKLWLDVRPLQYGSSVPLRVSVEYADDDGQGRIYQETLYMAVARTEGTRTAGQIFNINVTGGGPVSVGGDAIDARNSRGAVIKPSGSVDQHFGDEIHEADATSRKDRRGKTEDTPGP